MCVRRPAASAHLESAILQLRSGRKASRNCAQNDGVFFGGQPASFFLPLMGAAMKDAALPFP